MNQQIHNKLDNYLSTLKSGIRAADNSTFAIGGASCSADSFVVTESSVLRMNICAENHAIANPQNVSGKFKNDNGTENRHDYNLTLTLL